MANQEHLDILRQGVGAWNLWRKENPETRPDLSQADLSGADLEQIDLSGANLRGADCTRAVLLGANIGRANFAPRLAYGDVARIDIWYADLIESSLERANLAGANLRNAQLVRANLRSAQLHGASLARAHLMAANLGEAELLWVDFHEAFLMGTDVTGANMGSTVLADVDLSAARGLEAVRHQGPSTVGVDTLVRTLRGGGGTFGQSQRQFFADAGIPDMLLDSLPRLFQGDPVQFYTCMISYADVDEPFPSKLFTDLKGAGVSCWKFDESAVMGRGVWANIDRAIRNYDKVIVICSERSLQRPAVLREIERALQKEDDLKVQQHSNPAVDADVLFPVRLDDFVFQGWQHERRADVVSKVIGDFRAWDTHPRKYKAELRRLVTALDPKSSARFVSGYGSL